MLLIKNTRQYSHLSCDCGKCGKRRANKNEYGRGEREIEGKGGSLGERGLVWVKGRPDQM